MDFSNIKSSNYFISFTCIKYQMFGPSSHQMLRTRESGWPAFSHICQRRQHWIKQSNTSDFHRKTSNNKSDDDESNHINPYAQQPLSPLEIPPPALAETLLDRYVKASCHKSQLTSYLKEPTSKATHIGSSAPNSKLATFEEYSSH